MKKIFLSSLLIFSFFSTFSFSQAAKQAQNSPVAAKTAVQRGIEIPFVNKTLANGLEVIVLPDASVPLVTVEMAVRNGSFTEPPELNGLSHLYEHMFFKPNKAYVAYQCEQAVNSGQISAGGRDFCANLMRLSPDLKSADYIRGIDNLGIMNNAQTREEVVNYYFTTTSPYLSTALRFMNDSIRFPRFDEEELEQEKQVVIGEVDRNEANPYFYLNRTLLDKLYYKYPTRKNPLGTRESVLAATSDKMRTIQSRYYVPNNSALIVTGNVKPEEVFNLVEQSFGSWKRREVDPFKEFPLVEHPPLQKSEGVIVEKNTGEEASANSQQNVFIQIGWHGPSVGKDDEATYAADVFSYIVAQPNSRFQRNLVDSGLVTSADIGYYTQRNVGPIILTLITTPEKAKAAVKAAYEEIAQFDKPDYFTDEELESAKTILESRDLFEREKLSEYAHTLAFWWSSTGIEYFRDYYKNLRNVSRLGTSRYVKTYIQGKPHIGIALLSPGAKTSAKLTEGDLIGQ
ncbi:MAG TPA: pitrilysin family protein [Pyrinomonadaceae bacterium]